MATYDQNQINQALRDVLASDPNASRADIDYAASLYGIKPDEVTAAYQSLNAPASTNTATGTNTGAQTTQTTAPTTQTTATPVIPQATQIGVPQVQYSQMSIPTAINTVGDYGTSNFDPITYSVSPTPNAPSANTYSADIRNVDPETETVQGQINGILDSNGLLMQRAAAQAREQMAKRGLINSSMAVGAAQGAMIDRAADIGAKDADIYSTARLANQQARNVASQFNAESQNKMLGMQYDDTLQRGRLGMQQNFESSENALERSLKDNMMTRDLASREAIASVQLGADVAKTNAELAAAASRQQADYQAAAARMQADLDSRASLQQLELESRERIAELQKTNQTLVNGNAAAADLISKSNDAIAHVLANSDMAPDTKTSAVNNIIENTKESLTRIGLVYDTDFSDIYPAADTTAGGTSGGTDGGTTGGTSGTSGNQSEPVGTSGNSDVFVPDPYGFA